MKRLLVALLLAVSAMPAAAGPPRLLATEDAWPIWSPNGHELAFTRIHQGRNLMQLDVVDVRTHRVTAIARNDAQLLPSWSPDGSRIAYQAGGSVYVATPGGAKTRLGPGGAPAFGPSVARVVVGALVVRGVVWARAVIGQPAWSPDGSRIAFQRANGIYLAAGPGGGALLVGGNEPGAPVWSPDGTRVAFAMGDEVWIAGRSLVPSHAVATARPDAGTPSWAPDGTAVVYAWRGGVTRTTTGGRSTLLHTPVGLGAAVGPDGTVADAEPRRGCPGHFGIVAGTTALTGTCVIRGTPGADVIEGTPLWGDVILAGAGNDLVHANDGHTDRVDCGPGRDTVWADRSDRLAGCEIVHR